MNPSLKLKKIPDPRSSMIAKDMFPRIGMLLYQSKFVGKSHRKSDSGPIKLNTPLIASNTLSIAIPPFLSEALRIEYSQVSSHLKCIKHSTVGQKDTYFHFTRFFRIFCFPVKCNIDISIYIPTENSRAGLYDAIYHIRQLSFPLQIFMLWFIIPYSLGKVLLIFSIFA